MALVALQHVESSQTRGRTRVPCISRWIPSHWTTREVPKVFSDEVKLEQWIFASTLLSNFPRKRIILGTEIDVCFLTAGEESACSSGDLGSILGLGRCPEEGKGYPLQYSGLENSMESQKVGHN